MNDGFTADLPETAHLLQSPANAGRLHESVERLESGGGIAVDATDLFACA